LFGEKRGLPLRQNQNPGGELDPRRDRGEIGKGGQRLVKLIGFVIGPVERGLTSVMRCA
jgi:hypothetical protein